MREIVGEFLNTACKSRAEPYFHAASAWIELRFTRWTTRQSVSV